MKQFHTISELSNIGKPVWATVGFFDGLHCGHQELLSCLSNQAGGASANSLVITFANLPRAYHQPSIKPKYLTMPDEKLLLLEEQGIDAVLMLEYDETIASQSAVQFIASLAEKCDLRGISVGYDSTLGNDMLSNRAEFRALADAAGIGIVFANEFKQDGEAVKSSTVRRLVEAGKILEANELLDHAYFVLGEVVHGKGKGGKLINMPTANLILPPTKLSPPLGVYACTCRVGNTTYAAATAVMNHVMAHTTPLEDNDAPVPVESAPDTIVVEANLDGFNGNLYGRQIRLDFHQRLRNWQCFDSPQELMQQIQADVEQTHRVCSVYL